MSTIALDYNYFPLMLESGKDLNIPDFKTSDNGKDAWEYYGNFKSSNYDKVVSFQYQNQVPGDDDPLNYRVWYMETSVVGDNMGLIVSCKIDYDRGNRDDHLTLICGFDATGKLVLAQAAAQFHGADDKNFKISPVIANTDGVGNDVSEGLYNAMRDTQKKVDYGDDRDNAGRKGFAYVAMMISQCFIKSVRA
ncbi:hypothetical protein [Hymenobacter jeollabukensis]|uniref:Uncharacterized protein n=1 Tax=Hymenobacter jeollabukensis TaxID=2025313 RepID=A0A5R8WLF8_9BACT|nr:hypothetical protein [Hymenobacter jeollabukensis]TLM89507.1 hypothetical protein FDY95_20765 [Hymenobacter jeollabukensis]